MINREMPSNLTLWMYPDTSYSLSFLLSMPTTIAITVFGSAISPIAISTDSGHYGT